MALLNCPCCGSPPPATPRTTPVTDDQARRGLVLCLARGVSLAQLLSDEYAETLEYCSPGFLGWLQRHKENLGGLTVVGL